MEIINNDIFKNILLLSSILGIIIKSKSELKTMYKSIIKEYEILLNTLKESESKCKEELEEVKSDIIKLRIHIARLEKEVK